MKIDLTNIKNIIFDLGCVLLNLDLDKSIKAFHELGFEQDVIDKMHSHADRIFYELSIGKVTPKIFRDRIRELLKNLSITDEEIDNAWNAMILDIPKHRVEMLKKLPCKYNVFLFSNTNPIHIDKLNREFSSEYKIDVSSLFVKVFYSHEVQKYKPDVSAYTKVIELAGINPEESIFIDDLKSNIEGAQKAGLKTFWLKDGKEITEVFESVI